MKKVLSILPFIISSLMVFGQSIDDPFPKKKMKKDFEIFKEIRQKANAGLYKYRTKEQIDSTYLWAEKEIEKANTYIDFYNIICELTDFEGSCHNGTELSSKTLENLRKEASGYFPYPIKWVDGNWLINFKDGEIPLGAEILELNGIPMDQVIRSLYKYYPSDGFNITGKRPMLAAYFSRAFRFNYGRKENFQVIFKRKGETKKEEKNIKSVSYKQYFRHFFKRHSEPFDELYYEDLEEDQKYGYEKLDASTGILSLNSFSMGNERSVEHKKFASFLDSVFTKIKSDELKNLIVDVRLNNGGDDPNDMISYSYLTSRNFQESKEVWISFQKVPLLKYYDTPVPRFLRPFGVGKHNRRLRERFPNKIDEEYHISKSENEMLVRTPNENAFTGNVYLLISPSVASAGSLFAAMVAGNKNTIVVGEETSGGYYGHNGHTPFGYKLPKSKIVTDFFIENLEQDVPKKSNQFYHRGIIPDYDVPQSYEDFLAHKDTQMEFVLELIRKE